MRRYSPSVMISFNFVAPVAGVLLGMAILGERLTAGLLGGMALVAREDRVEPFLVEHPTVMFRMLQAQARRLRNANRLRS